MEETKTKKPTTEAAAKVKPEVAKAEKSVSANVEASKAAKTVSTKTEAAKVAKPVAKKSAAKPVAKTVDPKNRNLRKTREGRVVSNKMNKTIVVAIQERIPHPLYGKIVAKTKKLKAHDENNECSIGDLVEIVETRPLSKDKYFRLVRVIEKVK